MLTLILSALSEIDLPEYFYRNSQSLIPHNFTASIPLYLIACTSFIGIVVYLPSGKGSKSDGRYVIGNWITDKLSLRGLPVWKGVQLSGYYLPVNALSTCV
jgi:hypothetical protein